jgi:hypothetical protein
MKNIVRICTISALTMLGLVMVPAGFGSVAYADNVDKACVGAQMAQGKTEANATAACADPDLGSKLPAFINNIINILLFVIGAIAVIMIIVGGLRYVISGGDTGSTKAARDTILYAVIGLVIAIMAYAIVNFVLVRL